jgi:hypothetical protein
LNIESPTTFFFDVFDSRKYNSDLTNQEGQPRTYLLELHGRLEALSEIEKVTAFVAELDELAHTDI